MEYMDRNKAALAEERARLGKSLNKPSDCRVKVVLSGIQMSPRQKLLGRDKMETDIEFRYGPIKAALQVTKAVF